MYFGGEEKGGGPINSRTVIERYTYVLKASSLDRSKDHTRLSIAVVTVYPRSEAAASNSFTLQVKGATIRGRLLNEGGDYYYNY